MNLLQLFTQGDAVSKVVALLLLAMSVASWVVILWKAWLLKRASGDVARGVAAFWQSPTVEAAHQKVAAFDREALVMPLIMATRMEASGTLAAAGDKAQQLTRVLRDALHAVLNKLQFGQVLLATVGSTAPFVGLLGTVWGIYQALTGIANAGQITIDKVSGPVGEALIMTAAGLAVAIPAVLAYNVFGRAIGRIEADLEGFARDLRELMAHPRSAFGEGRRSEPPLFTPSEPAQAGPEPRHSAPSRGRHQQPGEAGSAVAPEEAGH